MNGIDTEPWPATLADAAKHHAPSILRVVATLAILWGTLHAIFWLLPAPSIPNQADVNGENVAIYFPKDVVAMRSWWSMRITTRRLNKLFTVPQVLQPAARVFYLVGAAAVVVLMAALAWSWTTRSIAWFIEWRNDPGLVVVGGDAVMNTDVIEQPVVQIPGVNMPLASLRPYLIGAVIAVLVHEAGHGMAAAAWNLGVHAVTLDVHLAVPVAAVHVRTPAHPTLLTDLALATAGIWHNLVLALLATTLATHPLTWLSFGYNAAPVTDPSGLLIVDPGPTPLPRYDRLVSVNGIRTRSVAAVADLTHIPPFRQCRVPTATVLPCCHVLDPTGELCFVHGNGTACASFPTDMAPSCTADSDCLVGACMAAYARAPHRVFAFTLASGESVVWTGDPRAFDAVQFGTVVPVSQSWPAWVPYEVVAVLEATASVSVSLAVVNAVPVAGLDGAHVIAAVAGATARRWRKQRRRRRSAGE